MLNKLIKDNSYLDEKIDSLSGTIVILGLSLCLLFIIFGHFYFGVFGQIYAIYGSIMFFSFLISHFIGSEWIFDKADDLVNYTKYGFLLLIPLLLPMAISYLIFICIYIRKYPNIRINDINDRKLKLKRITRKTKRFSFK